MPQIILPPDFAGRSVAAALGFLKEAIFAEETARSRGFLQRADPRVKMAGCLVVLLAISLVRDAAVLALIYAASVMLAALSGIAALSFIARTWVFIPLFALVIAVPAACMVGVYPALVFVLRVAGSVSYAVLLAVTTPHNRLLGALRQVGVPAVFIQVLDMTYRYIFLFITVFEDMHLALRARSVRRLAGRDARAWVGGRMGYLFMRSARMSEEVYLAMLARGGGGR